MSDNMRILKHSLWIVAILDVALAVIHFIDAKYQLSMWRISSSVLLLALYRMVRINEQQSKLINGLHKVINEQYKLINTMPLEQFRTIDTVKTTRADATKNE